MVVRQASWALVLLVLTAGPVAAQGPHACMGIMIDRNADGGVVIVDVSVNGPGDLAWMRAGDVIQGLVIGGKTERPVRTIRDLSNLMAQLLPGDTVEVRYQRGKQKRVTDVTVRPEPPQPMQIRAMSN